MSNFADLAIGMSVSLMPHNLATPGIGPAKAARIAAALEIARRVINGGVEDRTPLRDPKASATFLKSRLVHLPYEVFPCLFLDNRHRVLAFEELFRGTVDAASDHLAHNATAVILRHYVTCDSVARYTSLNLHNYSAEA